MSVSIIIPVRNGRAFLAEAVRSALAQPEAADVIVVDDGSSDGSADLVRAMTDARLRLVAGPRRGVSAARNLGLARSRELYRSGETAPKWIMFLDADDRLRPGALASLLRGVEGDCVAVYGDYDRIDDQGRPIGRRRWLGSRRKPSGEVLRALLTGNFIVNGGVMLIRREAFEAIGGFDESLRYCEDWHAFCRLAARGPVLWRADADVLDYRVHDASAMMGSGVRFRDCQPALDRVFCDPELTARLNAGEREALRRRAEAHLRTYVVCQALRSRRYATVAPLIFGAMCALPSRAPRVLLRAAAAAAGF